MLDQKDPLLDRRSAYPKLFKLVERIPIIATVFEVMKSSNPFAPYGLDWRSIGDRDFMR